MNRPKAARYVRPYQWMARGPSFRATGSICGYMSMTALCRTGAAPRRDSGRGIEYERRRHEQPHTVLQRVLVEVEVRVMVRMPDALGGAARADEGISPRGV